MATENWFSGRPHPYIQRDGHNSCLKKKAAVTILAATKRIVPKTTTNGTGLDALSLDTCLAYRRSHNSPWILRVRQSKKKEISFTFFFALPHSQNSGRILGPTVCQTRVQGQSFESSDTYTNVVPNELMYLVLGTSFSHDGALESVWKANVC